MSESLGKVAQLARLEEQHAAKSARSQRGALGDAQARLEQLQTFRREYEGRLAGLAGDTGHLHGEVGRRHRTGQQTGGHRRRDPRQETPPHAGSPHSRLAGTASSM